MGTLIKLKCDCGSNAYLNGHHVGKVYLFKCDKCLAEIICTSKYGKTTMKYLIEKEEWALLNIISKLREGK